MKYRILLGSLTLALGASSLFAQTTTADTVQRDVNQQTRIENGLKNGSLTVKEAGRLEREQRQIDRLQAKDLKEGKLTPAERAQLRRLQDRASRDIKAAETNAANGDPNSKSSQRLQADVQRNVNQEKRIEQGVQSGALSSREVGALEGGQARAAGSEAVAARDGHIGQAEQAEIKHRENRQSKRIHVKMHNTIVNKG